MPPVQVWEGNCSYGTGCKFSHSKSDTSGTSRNSGNGKFSPKQRKAVSTMMTNKLKKALKTAIKKKGSKRKREANQHDSDDDNLATILATCVGMVGTARAYPRHPIGLDIPDSFADHAPSMLSSLHDTSANMGWDTDAALTITCLRDDVLWLDGSEEAIGSIPSLQGKWRQLYCWWCGSVLGSK